VIGLSILKKYLDIKWEFYFQLDDIVSSYRGINNTDGVTIQQNYEMFKTICDDIKSIFRGMRNEK
jgi:hypothetical protein